MTTIEIQKRHGWLNVVQSVDPIEIADLDQIDVRTQNSIEIVRDHHADLTATDLKEHRQEEAIATTTTAIGAVIVTRDHIRDRAVPKCAAGQIVRHNLASIRPNLAWVDPVREAANAKDRPIVKDHHEVAPIVVTIVDRVARLRLARTDPRSGLRSLALPLCKVECLVRRAVPADSAHQ